MSDWRGPMRFIARYDWEQLHPPPLLYGIWDNLRGDWAARSFVGRDAGLYSAALCLRYAGSAERPERDARWVSPGIHVELTIGPARTEVALLHMWAREVNGWHGYLTYLQRSPIGTGIWAHSSMLRCMSAAEVDQFKEQAHAGPARG